MPSFQLLGLASAQFSSLFALTDAALHDLNICRMIATKNPGYPCRVGLVDAEIGDELLLLPFEHQAAQSPYKASGPIFVRKASAQAIIAPGVIPDYVSSRQISIRAYDAAHMMIDAVVCEGVATSRAIGQLFAVAAVEYLHLHNAKRGCFSCAVKRCAE
jgi:hypothetical protein